MENKTKFLLFILLQIFLVAGAQHWDDFGPPPDLDFYIRERDPYYHAVCTAKDRCVTTCTADYQDGCVCYKDGTCVEQSVNRCHKCTDENVFAVFEGQRCPKRHPFICHYYRHQHHKLHYHLYHKRDHGMGRFCKVEKFPSCVCTENGNCFTKIIDLCNDCSDKSYLAVFLNSSCPDKSLQAVCNKTVGSNPPPTTCNDPYAYLCQAQDRNSTTCDLESSPQGCVCYSNGNCVSQPVSACACQRPDIVSVYTGDFCPTNCTGTPYSTPAEQSEEGESESSNEETIPENEENTEGEKSEGEKSEGEKSEGEKSESESSVVLDNLEDEFSSKNPYRVLNCTLPGAYQCQNSDRNASNCSRISSNSCICDNKGSCISVFTNRCNACSKNDVITIYENGFCPSNCSASTNNSGNDSENDNTNSSVSPNSNTNTNGNTDNTNGNAANTNGNNSNTDDNNANSNDNTNYINGNYPPYESNNLDTNLTPETGEGENAQVVL